MRRLLGRTMGGTWSVAAPSVRGGAGAEPGARLLKSPGVRAAATDGHSSSSTSTGPAPRVVVLGGGFGGLYAAVRLEQLMWPRGMKPQVTLVDQSDRFVFKPLLYELLNGGASEEEVAPPFGQLLAPYAVRFVQ
ncbi:NADH dehydrogenase C1, chloroplastic/mitochondrial, partial [Tetrabaena socialis]